MSKPPKPQDAEPQTSEKTVSFRVDAPATVSVTVGISITLDSGEAIPPDVEQPPIEPPPVEPPDFELPPAEGRELLVGPSREYKEPADAAAAAQPGDTITIDDGRYVKAFYTEVEGLVLRSRSGNPYKCFFDGQGGAGGGHELAYGKGMVYVGRSITIEGLGFQNCGSPASGSSYGNEAGVWMDRATPDTVVEVVVWRCAFDGCANGAFAIEQSVSATMVECLYGFLRPNGQNHSLHGGSGPAHDNYLQCGEVTVHACIFYGCQGGHNVKSRAPKTSINGNVLTQDGGRAIDISDAGEVLIADNEIHTRTDRANQQPPGTFGNSNCIGYATEGAEHGGQCRMERNVLHISRTGSTIWGGGNGIVASGDTIWLYDQGSVRLDGNVTGLPEGKQGQQVPPLPQPPDWAQPPSRSGGQR